MTISNEDIETLAGTPKKARTEEGSVEERSVSELIAADRYSKGKTAADAVPYGVRMARVKPGGTV